MNLALAKDASQQEKQQIISIMKKYNVPGLAIAKLEKGDIQWMGYYGKTASGTPIAEDSIFNIASLTKPMFAMLWLKATQNTDIKLDTPLNAYWVDPDIQDDPRHKNLTARLLLSHQGGFQNWRGKNTLSIHFEPGTRIEYSGEGFEYLMRALEKKTSKSMASLMETHITSPLNMHHTFFGWNNSFNDNFVGGFDESGKVTNTDYLKNRDANAACCTFTTLNDYTQFTRWIANGAQGINKNMFKQAIKIQAQHENPAEYFGLSWRLITIEDTLWLTHDGRENGVRTLVMVNPKTGDGLVALTNSDNGELIMRPIMTLTLSDSQRILHRMDLDVWQLLLSIPASQQEGMLKFIARSPSFISKAMYAIQTALIEQSKLTKTQKDKAEKLIDRIVLGVQTQHLNAEDVFALFKQLDDESDKGFRIKNSITEQEALNWLKTLEKLAKKTQS
ncbi:serine hydrolase domain-containing protein [Marinicella sp. W31]|uniref:serine hydrolase domain-containing protein n=1 Tax=Marinicella sp. W31 TaxID=3023713 RepID=UPI00375781A7